MNLSPWSRGPLWTQPLPDPSRERGSPPRAGGVPRKPEAQGVAHLGKLRSREGEDGPPRSPAPRRSAPGATRPPEPETGCHLGPEGGGGHDARSGSPSARGARGSRAPRGALAPPEWAGARHRPPVVLPGSVGGDVPRAPGTGVAGIRPREARAPQPLLGPRHTWGRAVAPALPFLGVPKGPPPHTWPPGLPQPTPRQEGAGTRAPPPPSPRMTSRFRSGTQQPGGDRGLRAAFPGPGRKWVPPRPEAPVVPPCWGLLAGPPGSSPIS